MKLVLHLDRNEKETDGALPGLGREKVPKWHCLFAHRNKAEKKQNLDPLWKKKMKFVDLGEPTSFLDHENLGCTQRECKENERIIEYNKKDVRITNLRQSN